MLAYLVLRDWLFWSLFCLDLTVWNCRWVRRWLLLFSWQPDHSLSLPGHHKEPVLGLGLETFQGLFWLQLLWKATQRQKFRNRPCLYLEPWQCFSLEVPFLYWYCMYMCLPMGLVCGMVKSGIFSFKNWGILISCSRDACVSSVFCTGAGSAGSWTQPYMLDRCSVAELHPS